MPSRRGFTLIELLVVISIIALLSSVVLSALNTARDKAKATRIARDLSEIRKALILYQADNSGAYPCFDHDWNSGDETGWSAPYFKWPTSPLGTPYHWEHSYPPAAPTTFSISVQAPTATLAGLLDQMLDRGDGANAGTIRYPNVADRLDFSGIDQTVPFNDCHI
ncbi:MAG: prepilin-type N-terminal cleavage/methylation domain-containing protein [Candidatus Taylorbacteria bacterium]|nr:prepilin-type N-terminal cleavage/methylation domain-containing protein [Candidatus Taylorbacteria bacterium]